MSYIEIDKLNEGANDTLNRHAFMTKYLSFVPKFYVLSLVTLKYFLPHHNIMHCNAQNFHFTRIFHIAFSRVLEDKPVFVVSFYLHDLFGISTRPYRHFDNKILALSISRATHQTSCAFHLALCLNVKKVIL